MFKPNNFYAVLNPMFHFTKILGLTPFKLARKGYEKSRLNLAWSLCLMIFLHIYTTITLHNRPSLNAGPITIVTEELDAYLSILGMCCGILFECIFANNILHSIQEINTFDKSFRYGLHIDLKYEYQKSKKYLIVALLATIIFVTVSMTFAIRYTIRSFRLDLIGDVLIYVGPILISTFVDFQFCSIILCLKQRFRWLNQIISRVDKNLDCENDLFFVVAHANRPATQVVTAGFMQDRALYIFEKIRDKHHKLCSVIKTINKSYSVQILLIVLQDFVTTILALFYMGKYVLTSDFISTQYILYASNQILLCTLQVVALVVICSATVSEAQKTGNLIHSAISKQTQCKEELQLEVSFFSLQLFHQNVEFTACRIFVINEGLFLSIVGALTTYLVIVIQFELSNNFL